MTRPFDASLGLAVSSSCLLALLGCTETPGSGSATSAGSASGGLPGGGGGGASSSGAASGGAGATSGGAAGQAAAGSSSGMSGTGPGNGGAAGQAGAGGGNCPGALLCDDFEAYTGMPGGPWTVEKNDQGSVAIDSAQHSSGSKAVKLTLRGAETYQRAFIGVTAPFPIAGNAFYGRMMIYIAAAPNDGVHWTMIQGEGPVATPVIERADVRYGGQHMKRLMANYDSRLPKSDCWKHSQTVMPEGKWACMEWQFEGATNTQKFWLDGQAIDDLTVAGQGEGCVSNETNENWYFPTFERLLVGFESYQTDDPREVWIDDVAVGTSKLGCPAP